jgi:hypothetical protein
MDCCCAGIVRRRVQTTPKTAAEAEELDVMLSVVVEDSESTSSVPSV